jgi:hypothetical protein
MWAQKQIKCEEKVYYKSWIIKGCWKGGTWKFTKNGEIWKKEFWIYNKLKGLQACNYKCEFMWTHVTHRSEMLY